MRQWAAGIFFIVEGESGICLHKALRVGRRGQRFGSPVRVWCVCNIT
ncbi:MAG: hypothetical protein Q4P66_01235 [Actinomycetaceae bacterium]|nr:hypothetical protein [Actinomycetaceae bacterium]